EEKNDDDDLYDINQSLSNQTKLILKDIVNLSNLIFQERDTVLHETSISSNNNEEINMDFDQNI
ncbi:25088_t:CDS:1, partial [Dentiscutata erythropus]